MHVLTVEGTDADNGVDGFLFFHSVASKSDFRTDDLTIGTTSGGSGGINAASGQTKAATSAAKVFNLPSTSGSVEKISFSLVANATGDVINNFEAGEDKIEPIISGATGGVVLGHLCHLFH